MNSDELESLPDETASVGSENYDSAFEPDSDVERQRIKRSDLAAKEKPASEPPQPQHINKTSKEIFVEEYSREEGRAQRFHYQALDAYSRHKKLVNDYLLYYPGARDTLFKRDKSKDKTDVDVIRENHRFLWSEEDETDTWGKRLAKKYYEKLFKEYCIADLSRYKENKIAMRWRIENEVVEGKGQFVCGNKSCEAKEGLRSWEVNFAYLENDKKKNALVKLRLCSDCSYKLNYRHQKHKIIKKEKDAKQSTSSEADSESGETSSRTEIESELWKKPVQLEDKSREDEFDDYFQDLFL
ncbi:hypothetical protein CHUAL_000162 [Chamberlinius hualienensis]